MRFQTRTNRRTLTGKSKWQEGFEKNRSKRSRKRWESFNSLKIQVLQKPTDITYSTKPRKLVAGKATLADICRMKGILPT